MTHLVRGLFGVCVAAVLSLSHRAEACGCFAPPSPAEPIVQAGERILFSVKDGKVTAHIQIQYAGDAKAFGWLLPVPAVPTLKLGSDELFAKLSATTQPRYRTALVGTQCPQIGCGCSPNIISRVSVTGENGSPTSPLVVTSSVGPYIYAVLRADDKTAMFQWLSDNRFFVPTGTDDAVGPYIRPGGYFLALKLKAGARSGDVTPVVLEYPSELPMIPLILTSVGATPNMGVQVYLLGNGRGVPRNYHHVVLNDALLDWINGTPNYAELVTRAVSEAPQKHAFITEYAATSAVMRDQLVPAGRFGTEQELASSTSPAAFVAALKRNGFDSPGATQPELPSAVVRLLLTDIPYPEGLAAQGIDERAFLSRLDYYLGTFRADNPALFTGYMLDFDAPSLAQQIFEQYVTPLRETNALFAEFPTLTRLYTTLNPEDMTEDPVFTFNAELPEVSPQHDAKLDITCNQPRRLITEQGWIVELGQPPVEPSSSPAALRVEVLGEEGSGTVVTDNHAAINTIFEREGLPMQGCATIDPMSVGLLFLMASLRRRRR